MKIISAEDLIRSIANDPEINGSNFAKMKRHIDNAPAVGVLGKCVFCGKLTNGDCVCPKCEKTKMYERPSLLKKIWCAISG